MTPTLQILHSRLQALPPGSIVLSPSDRARRSFERFWQRGLLAKGGAAFAPEFLTVDQWLRRLWSDAQCFGLVSGDQGVVSSVVEAALWREAVIGLRNRDSVTSSTEAAAVATLMQEAFALEARYASAPNAEHAIDASLNGQLYADAKRAVTQRLAAGHTISPLSLAALIAQNADALAPLLPSARQRLLLSPSFAPIPSVEIALAALEAVAVRNGASPFERISVADSAHRSTVRRFEFPNVRTEREQVIGLAMDSVARGESAMATIVVPSLSSTREQWRRSLVEANAPFNLSIGGNLSSFSDVGAWLTVLGALIGEPVDVELIAQALRHSRWGLSEEQRKRVSALELEFLNRSKKNASLDDFALAAGLPTIERIDRRRTQTRDAWLRVWQGVAGQLEQGAKALDSASFQLRAALEALSDRWLELDRWMPPLNAASALAEWRDQLSATPFQPENSGASIEVMGLLESAGTINDSLWVTGLIDSVLPERSRLNPFLSAAWQRREGIGLAGLSECGVRAERLWRGWCGLSQSLTVTTAESEAGNGLLPSPLIATIPSEIPIEAPFKPVPLRATQDEGDSSLLTHRAKLNASGLEAQAACPRRGWALGRLRATLWPERFDGLSPLVRGTILHKVAELLGKHRIAAQARGESVESAAQLALLPSYIQTAIDLGRADVVGIADEIWALEAERLQALFEKFIALEADREPFDVVSVEHEITHQICGATFNLRVDRIERLGDERLAILDIKSGVSQRTGLVDARLSSPQLPLYALALESSTAADMASAVSAISFVQINDKAVEYVGLADAGEAQRPMRSPRQKEVFPDLMQRWSTQLAALVNEFTSGVAPVAPAAGAETCKRCGFQRLCRVDLRALAEVD